MKLLDLIKQFGQANYNYGLFNGTDKLQKQYDAERMDLFKQIVKQVSVEPEVMQKIAEQCQWIKEDEEGVYETDCKHSFQFISDGVKENHFNHCPYCGKPIIEIDLTEDCGRLDEEADEQAEGL